MKKILEYILSIPKSIYFNLKVLPLKQAISFPFFIGYKTKFGKLNRVISIKGNPTFMMIKINIGGTESRKKNDYGFISLGEKSKISFLGKAHLSSGVSLIADTGELSFGDNFFCNCNCSISCNGKITLENDVMCGWNVEFLDSDNHMHYLDGCPKKVTGEIYIGKHVWVASYVHILKGCSIQNDSIIAYGSIANKPITENHCLIGGVPAKMIKKGVTWDR